jgi:hypothetical protein
MLVYVRDRRQRSQATVPFSSETGQQGVAVNVQVDPYSHGRATERGLGQVLSVLVHDGRTGDEKLVVCCSQRQ